MKCKSKVESLAGKSLEEIVDIKPVNLATKNDLRLVNDLLRFGFKTVEEVVNEAIISENPTLMSLVSKYVNGVSSKQKERLTEAIKNADEEVLVTRKSSPKKSKTNEIIEEAKRTGKSIKWVAERRKVEAIIKRYANLSLEELVRFSPVNMYASKTDVRAVNYLIHKGLRTVDNVVDEAIASGNAKLIYYILRFVDGVTDYHKSMLINAANKTDDTVMIYNIAHKFPDTVNVLSRGIVNSGIVTEMVSFARNINNAPLDDLKDEILQRVTKEEADYIVYFVRDHFDKLSEDYVKRAANKIKELKNPAAICHFAQFGGAALTEFADSLIEAVNGAEDGAVYLYIFTYFNYSNPEIPIKNIVEALIKTRNYRYIYRMVCNIPLDEAISRKLIDFIVSKCRVDSSHYCNNLLLSLALAKQPFSVYAMSCIMDLKNQVLIDYISQRKNDGNENEVLEPQELSIASTANIKRVRLNPETIVES